MLKSTISPEAIKKGEELVRIGQRAVEKVQKENRRLGIPNVYSIDGTLYYELPNGELSRINPLAPEPRPTRRELMRQLVVEHRIRSVADYAEQIVAEALDGKRERNCNCTGFDVAAPGRGRIEVKFRQLPLDGRVEERVSLNEKKQNGFDYLAVVIFAPDFSVKGAVLVPYAEAWKIIDESPYGRISYSQACSCNGAINITDIVNQAAQK
jgi:hypothetical protein